MNQTMDLIIKKAKKKIQHLDTERILCYTADIYGNIISGRTISKNNQSGYAYLDGKKFLNIITPSVYYIVIVHNHPRSTMLASEEDDTLTRYIKKYTDSLQITLYDHIIIMKNSDDVYSYREKRRIVIPKTKKPPVVVKRMRGCS